MIKTIPESIQLLLKEFTTEYCSLRETLDESEKKHLLYFSSQIFSKWYFSTLINDTFLSPANIVSKIMEQENDNSYYTVGISHAQSENAFDFTLFQDSAENSTFINDLKTLCLNCRPYGKLYPKKQEWYNIANELRNRMAFDDPYYLNYLLDMACHLDLLKTMPSIGTVVYQYNEEKGNAFFSLPVYESMKHVFEAALVIFRKNIMDELMLPPEAISVKEIKLLLNENHVSDDIIACILGNIDISFEEATESAMKENLDEDDEALVASVVFLSGALGKWLFTPLGTYMKILKPLHCVSLNLNTELDYIRPFMHLDFDLTCELFSCCNYYSFTPFGKLVVNPPEDNYSEEMENIHFDTEKIHEILDASNYYRSVQDKALEIFRKYSEIYRFKVSFKKDESMWKIIEVDTRSTLAQLSKAIDSFFGIFDNEDYIFNIEGKQYVARSNKRSFAKADDAVLAELNIENTAAILYSNPYNKDDDLMVEFLSIDDASYHSVYPRLLKQSKEITASEKSEF